MKIFNNYSPFYRQAVGTDASGGGGSSYNPYAAAAAAAERERARLACLASCNSRITAALQDMSKYEKLENNYREKKAELEQKMQTAVNMQVSYAEGFKLISNCVPGMKINHQECLEDNFNCMQSYCDEIQLIIHECDNKIEEYHDSYLRAVRKRDEATRAKNNC